MFFFLQRFSSNRTKQFTIHPQLTQTRKNPMIWNIFHKISSNMQATYLWQSYSLQLDSVIERLCQLTWSTYVYDPLRLIHPCIFIKITYHKGKYKFENDSSPSSSFLRICISNLHKIDKFAKNYFPFWIFLSLQLCSSRKDNKYSIFIQKFTLPFMNSTKTY